MCARASGERHHALLGRHPAQKRPREPQGAAVSVRGGTRAHVHTQTHSCWLTQGEVRDQTGQGERARLSPCRSAGRTQPHVHPRQVREMRNVVAAVHRAHKTTVLEVTPPPKTRTCTKISRSHPLTTRHRLGLTPLRTLPSTSPFHEKR